MAFAGTQTPSPRPPITWWQDRVSPVLWVPLLCCTHPHPCATRKTLVGLSHGSTERGGPWCGARPATRSQCLTAAPRGVDVTQRSPVGSQHPHGDHAVSRTESSHMKPCGPPREVGWFSLHLGRRVTVCRKCRRCNQACVSALLCHVVTGSMPSSPAPPRTPLVLCNAGRTAAPACEDEVSRRFSALTRIPET